MDPGRRPAVSCGHRRRTLGRRPRSGATSPGSSASAGSRSADYDELWRWSVDDLAGVLVVDLGLLRGQGARARTARSSPPTRCPAPIWFPGARLNFAEHLVGGDEDAERVAVVAHSQTRDPAELSFARAPGAGGARAGRPRFGSASAPVTASSPTCRTSPRRWWRSRRRRASERSGRAARPSSAPRSVVDRLVQLEPSVLLTVGGYGFRDRSIDRREEVATIRAALPTLRHVVHVPYGDYAVPDALSWDELLAEPAPLAFEPVAFDHPLFVLFSSGTTGRPKAIVHGHGGILLEYLKAHALQLGPEARAGACSGSRTTSWMMWNALVAALARALVDRDARRRPDLAGPRAGSGGSRRRRARPSWA